MNVFLQRLIWTWPGLACLLFRSREEVGRAEAARMATAFDAFVNQVRLDALALRLSESVNSQSSAGPLQGQEADVPDDVQR